MRGPLLLLLASVIFIQGLRAEESPCQASKPAPSKSTKTTNSGKPGKPKVGCTCALFPIAPDNWYGEYHPNNSNCQAPEVVYMDLPNLYSMECTPDCSNCLQRFRPSVIRSPILKRPVEANFFPIECIEDAQMIFPYEHARYCTFTAPQYITFHVRNGRRRTVTAKLFKVTIDMNARTGRSGSSNHIVYLGFECKTPDKAPKEVTTISEEEGNATVDIITQQAIVLLAQ